MFSFLRLTPLYHSGEQSGSTTDSTVPPATSTEILRGTLRYPLSRADLPIPLGLVPLGDADRILLTPTHMPRLRNELTRAMQMLGWQSEPLDIMLDGAEAMANVALQQGVGGELQLRASVTGEQVQIWVRDRRQEQEAEVPLASIAAFGDQVSCLTDEEGTTWVIEQSRVTP